MTRKEVQELLKESSLSEKEFDEYMFGNTVGLYSDGTINYYEIDVNSFINLKKDHKRSFGVICD